MPAPERITAALIPKASAALAAVAGRTGRSKTDIVNRAIEAYEFIDAEIASGAEILVRHGDRTSVVKLL
jgi:predicted DNA-binding protein